MILCITTLLRFTRFTRLLFSAAIFLLISFALPAQVRYYVDQAAQGTATGLSWTDAFPDVQSALTSAVSGDEIWVATGTYKPTGTTDRTMSFVLKSGVRLYGGFAAVETDLSERNWSAYPTILSGDIGTPGDSLDNVYNVLYMPFPDSTTVLDGFVIRDGNANYGGGSTNRDRRKCGGGVYIDAQDGEAYPLIENCTIIHNTSKNLGGGMMINAGGTGSAAPEIKNCRFIDNMTAGNGGGLYKFGGSWVDRKYDLYKCAFIHNTSEFHGGGYFYNDTERSDQIDIVCDTFTGNIANHNCGGLQMVVGRENRERIVVKDCDFSENMGAGYVALYISTVNFLPIDSCWISGNHFHHHDGQNEANKLLFVSLGGDSLSVINFEKNLIDYNIATLDLFSIEFPYGKSININDNQIVHNESHHILAIDYGDVVKFNRVRMSENNINFELINILTLDSIIITNSEIVNDFTTIDSSILFGTAITKVLVLRNIITDRLFSFFFEEDDYSENLPDKFFFINSANILNNIPLFNLSAKYYTYISNSYLNGVNCSLITPEMNIVCGPGMIGNVNPQFYNTPTEGYRLKPCSPLIGAGTLDGVIPGEKDLDGTPRVKGHAIDIGPYEALVLTLAQEPDITRTCPGDSTGTINFQVKNQCGNLQYGWTGPGNSSGSNLTNLPVGNYWMTVTDIHNDTMVFFFAIPAFPVPQLQAQTTPVFCGTNLGGSAQLTGTTGLPPYQFDWGNGITDSQRTGLVYGVYPVTITDSRGCSAVGEVHINRSGNLQVQVDKSLISCYGASDGAIHLTPMNGAPPFNWQWDWNNSTEAAITGLPPGIYTGTLKDALGCGLNWVIPLDNPDSIAIAATMTPSGGPTAADGAIALLLQGGTGNLSVIWDNGAAGPVIDSLLPGFYTATVTDENSCSRTVTVAVTWSVGTATARGTDFQVWPNPVTTTLYVQPPSGIGAFQCSVLDALGRVVLQMERSDDSAFSVEMVGLPAGTYYWKMKDAVGDVGGVLIKH